MNNFKKYIAFTLSFLIFHCAGFHNKPIVLESKNRFSSYTDIRLEFSGFKYYEKEKNILKKEILKLGYIENSESELLLEVLLEEKETVYKYPFLHGINFVASLFTLGLIPYYTCTEHKITFRFSLNSRNFNGSTQILQLDQLRGLSILPITYFFWPSEAFEQSLIESLKIQETFK